MLRLIAYLLLTPTCDLPYLDSLPLEMPNRREVYGHYRGMVPNKEWCCTQDYPADREATRLFLTDQLVQGKSADEVWYLLGRLQGRHVMWTTWYSENEDRFITGWFDEWFNQPKPQMEEDK